MEYYLNNGSLTAPKKSYFRRNSVVLSKHSTNTLITQLWVDFIDENISM